MALPDLHFALETHLQRIERFFKPGAKLTLVVRNPSVPGDAGALLTDDDLDEVIAEIQRRKADMVDDG